MFWTCPVCTVYEVICKQRCFYILCLPHSLMNAAVGFNYLMHLDSRIDATTPPSTVGVGGKWGRAHVLLECACPVSQGGTFRASLQAEFLDRGSSAIWLSWSAASSQHLFRLCGPSSVKLCHWTPKQLSQCSCNILLKLTPLLLSHP